MVTFALEKKADKNGQVQDTLVRKEDGKPDEDWGTVNDFDRLFAACSQRWAEYGWDLEKLITAVRECQFD
jgi:hypothetical protein